MTSQEIAKRKWTKREREAFRSAAAAQAAGDDSGIDFSDIPRLTQDRLSALRHERNGRLKS